MNAIELRIKGTAKFFGCEYFIFTHAILGLLVGPGLHEQAHTIRVASADRMNQRRVTVLYACMQHSNE